MAVENLLSKRGGVKPEGTLNITENDIYDVTNYSTVDVRVESANATTDEDILKAISNTNLILGIEPVWSDEEINSMLEEYSSYRNSVLGLGG